VRREKGVIGFRLLRLGHTYGVYMAGEGRPYLYLIECNINILNYAYRQHFKIQILNKSEV